MCHFLAPVGQPEMMHKNFMHRHLRIFVVLCSRMKFYAKSRLVLPFVMESNSDHIASTVQLSKRCCAARSSV